MAFERPRFAAIPASEYQGITNTRLESIRCRRSTDPIHLEMLRNSRRAGLPKRLGLYGLGWGNPSVQPHLKFVRDRFISPYLDLDHAALEIGPGGGHPPLRAELPAGLRRRRTRIARRAVPQTCDRQQRHRFSRCSGRRDRLRVLVRRVCSPRPAESSRGTSASLGHVVGPSANIVIQYSATDTKEKSRLNEGFSDDTAGRMRRMVLQAGYAILEENLRRPDAQLDHAVSARLALIPRQPARTGLTGPPRRSRPAGHLPFAPARPETATGAFGIAVSGASTPWRRSAPRSVSEPVASAAGPLGC